MSEKILVVEDEQTILDSLVFGLEREGYIVVPVRDGSQAVDRFRLDRPDAVLLDLMLGPTDGFDVLRTLRHGSSVPIIILTARNQETDKVAGLELGADDYVTKPFSLRELIARLRAHLRKHRGSPRDASTVRLGALDINWSRAEVDRGDVRVFLTAREFEVLRALYDHRDRLLTRDWLLEHVWGPDFDGDARVVDTTVKRLRKKLEADVIETVRGLGYRLLR